MPFNALNLKSVSSNELEGAAFRMLSPDVAYLKVSTAKQDEISRYIEAASKTKGFVVDLRGYPSEFVVFKLGGHFVDKQTPFVRFSIPDLSNPGAFNWMEPTSLMPQRPHYDGKVLVLVDESTQSQAEYTAMALRAAPKSDAGRQSNRRRRRERLQVAATRRPMVVDVWHRRLLP